MRKSFVRAAIVLGLSGVMTFNTLALTFADVTTSHWAYAGIDYMTGNNPDSKKYMAPNNAGEFKPNEQMTLFEVADLLAKVWGYEDKLVNPNIDPELSNKIDKNYAVYKPIIETYSSKYTGVWNNSANEEIGYLLAHGFILEEELDSFISTDASGKKIKAIAKKEDLAAILVRMMYKEETAKKEYKAGSYTDESKIAEAKRPHAAYLKTLGLVNGTAFGAGDPVTRALAAKMTTDVMKKVDKEDSTTTTPSDTAELKDVTINKIVDKGNGERYILVQFEDGKTSFYNMKEDVKVTTSTGAVLTIDDVAVGAKAKVKFEKINTSDYITQMQLVINGTTTTPDPTPETKPETTPDTKPETTPDTKPETKPEENNESVVSGKELKSKVETKEEYIITLQDTSGTKEITVPKTATIKRNGKTIDFINLKIGDTISFTTQSGKVTLVEATSEEQTITGKVQSVLLAATPEVTVLTADGPVTAVLTPGADLYDKKARQDISVQDIMLFSEVTVELDSKEATSLTVTAHPGKTNEQGTIKAVGDGGKYIDVLVYDDKLTGNSMVIKRINVPGEVSILIDGKEQYRNLLKEDMDVYITYDYSKSMNPQTIKVLN